MGGPFLGWTGEASGEAVIVEKRVARRSVRVRSIDERVMDMVPNAS